MPTPQQHQPPTTYQFKLGKNCDELLAHLSEHLFLTEDPIHRPATIARFILLQALIDCDSVLERAMAAGEYTVAEDLPYLAYMDAQVQFATKKARKRFRQSRRAK